MQMKSDLTRSFDRPPNLTNVHQLSHLCCHLGALVKGSHSLAATDAIVQLEQTGRVKHENNLNKMKLQNNK